ncbi:MAG: alpha/beta hydrolase [Solirubrobacteraceae bacterium]|jgi:pimeloyl-ACP methyl ester carboxylesterase
MITGPPRLLFLPGIAGEGSFWEPVADLLPAGWRRRYLDWPGLGPNPPSPHLNTLDDLVDLVIGELTAEETVVVAQSMGCVVAMRAALREPAALIGLVLTVSPGAVNMPNPLPQHPPGLQPPDWILAPLPDQTERLRTLAVPTLLISATRDPISPLAVAEELARTLPNATLVAIDSDDHGIARSHAAAVAQAIESHVSKLR